MTWMLLGLVAWLAGIVCIRIRRARYYKRYPNEWNLRHSGLISFTDRDRLWMTILWPLTLAVLIIVYLALGILLLVRWFKSLKER